jgi:hypothetical protein
MRKAKPPAPGALNRLVRLSLAWVMIAAVVLPLSALAASQSNFVWGGSQISSLRKLDKAGVAALVNNLADPSIVPGLAAGNIGDFAWKDLGGDGTYQLVVVKDVGRRFYNALIVYNREKSGKLDAQEIRGWNIQDLSAVVRDLNGDGKDELIVPSQLPCSSYRGAGAIPTWPAVYRLEKGHYVEASRDFPAFYDNEILPKLNSQMSNARNEQQRVWLTMERNEILRVIGRSPTAGLQEAYQWRRSSDPELRADAAVVFCQIGGHQQEIRTLSQDKDLSVADAAKFALLHHPGDFARWNRGRRCLTIVNPPN